MSEEDIHGVGERWIDDWKRRSDKLLSDTNEVAAKMDKLRVTATNADNDVRVTVNARGAVEDLRLKDGIRSKSIEDMASEIMTTMRKAQSQLAEGARRVVVGTVGAESDMGKATIDGFNRRFGKTEERGQS
ncbi:YbaB/EbfC family nucleoid-associated protein [Stackebrandtia soli]|uniref:YbaB/EbfC family nucleoid-associated protein n=1 Tax=Stackebrandtia soli TaxID=1892856 RepID=UPI0039E7B468